MTQKIQNIFELRDVFFSYDGDRRALDHCSAKLEKNRFTSLLGLNGSGKTTFLLHLVGIYKPYSGQVFFDGNPLDYSKKGLRELRARVGMVFQNPDSQLFSASVMEDVSFGPINLGLDMTIVRERVERSLDLVGMLQYSQKPVHNLSFGQKKRVCIAGVLAMEPQIILLDEPMAGLDYEMQENMISLLLKLREQGLTIITATHDIDFAYEFSDNLIFLSDGRCVLQDNTEIDLDTWIRIGIKPPKVVELHKTLSELGVIKENPKPKGMRELINLLRKPLLNRDFITKRIF